MRDHAFVTKMSRRLAWRNTRFSPWLAVVKLHFFCVAAITLIAVQAAQVASAASLSLDGTVGSNDFIRFINEPTATNSYPFDFAEAVISRGTGAAGDVDGWYDQAGVLIPFQDQDVFPNETSFTIGTITFADVSPTFTGTTPITGFTDAIFDFGGAGPRDIESAYITNITMNAPNAADGTTADFVEFINGDLADIQLSLNGFIFLNPGFGTEAFLFDLVVDGNDVSLTANATSPDLGGSFGNTLVVDIQGVNNVTFVPEPSSALLLALGGSLLFFRRRESIA